MKLYLNKKFIILITKYNKVKEFNIYKKKLYIKTKFIILITKYKQIKILYICKRFNIYEYINNFVNHIILIN